MIVSQLPGALFRVRLDDGQEVIAHVARELREVIVRVKPGDRVECVREAEDPKRARITEVRT